MASKRRKSLLRGMDIEDVVSRGVMKRVLAKDTALKMYAFGYKMSTAEYAGWLLFLSNYLDKYRAELMSLSPKERSARVQDLVAKAAEEWQRLSDDQKREWIEKAKGILANEKARIQESLKLSEEIERLAHEAYKSIDELVSVLAR